MFLIILANCHYSLLLSLKYFKLYTYIYVHLSDIVWLKIVFLYLKCFIYLKLFLYYVNLSFHYLNYLWSKVLDNILIFFCHKKGIMLHVVDLKKQTFLLFWKRRSFFNRFSIVSIVKVFQFLNWSVFKKKGLENFQYEQKRLSSL